MTILLNEVAKRERPQLRKKVYVKNDLMAYVKANATPEKYEYIRDELMYVEDSGVHVDWQASNIDNAFVWAKTPQGDEYWSKIHGYLEYGDD